MKICPICNKAYEDEKSFCTVCGSKLVENVVPAPPVAPAVSPAPVTPPANKLEPEAIAKAEKLAVYDHTEDFEAEDIAENKIYAMLVYLLGIVGIVIAKLCAADSKFVAFHIREEIKITIIQLLCAVITLASFYLVVTPVAFSVISVILMVVRIIAFFKVVGGKAEEVAIIRNFTFLK